MLIALPEIGGRAVNTPLNPALTGRFNALSRADYLGLAPGIDARASFAGARDCEHRTRRSRMRLIYKGFSHRSSGAFTLLELLTTMAVAAILLSLTVPAFSKSLARSRQSAEINALFHAFYLARKESIRRRTFVSLCPTNDSRSCAPGRDWSDGWLLFENPQRADPPVLTPGAPPILVHGGTGEVRITANRRGFTSRGIRKRATNGTLVFCDPGSRVPARALVVSYTGRPRIADRRRNGEEYDCAD